MEWEGSIPAVLIVASAASGDAIDMLLTSFPRDFPAIVMMALSTERGHITDITARLGNHVPLPLSAVTDRAQLAPGSIAVVSLDHDVNLADRALWLEDAAVGTADDESHNPTDVLTSRAAAVYGEDLVVVLMAGLGTDGVDGARNVRAAGGMVIVQKPASPVSPAISPALALTYVDVVAPIEAIGAIVQGVVMGDHTQLIPQGRESLLTLLDHLREELGIDFNSSKMPTIMRRLQRRLVATGTTTLATYTRYLRLHPTEYQRLVSSFLVKVTEFFRNRKLFDYLRDGILPELVRYAQSHSNSLRIWSAGCATGEEAYSLAILLAEELENYTVRIFATDLDVDAVAFARRGVYSRAALAQMPKDLIARYFVAALHPYPTR